MEPLGLLSLATAVRDKGHQVKILDVFPEHHINWLNTAKKFAPDLIGYSFETPSYWRIQQIHQVLRKELPKAIYCAGGIHPTVMPEETLKDLDLSFVVYGEGEVSFPEILRSLEQKGDISACPGIVFIKDNHCIKTKSPDFVQDLDLLPIADRTLLEHNQFYYHPPGNIRGLVHDRCATVITSRGCPFSCIFCESKILMGKKYRQRSPQHVVNEIKYLYSEFGIRTIYFADDIFTFNSKWIVTFCDLISQLPFSIVWGCQSRADTLEESILDTMKMAGCRQIDLGIESGDPEVLKNIRKNETVEQYIKAADLIHKSGLRLLCSFIVGAPGETWESVKKTQSLIRRLKPSMCQYFTLIPYPGSELYKEALEHKWFGSLSFSQLGSQKQFDQGFLTCGLSPEDQIKARKILHKTTFVRDHLNLITGWFFHPQWLLIWLWVAIRNYFFIVTFIKSIRTGNPSLLMFKAYEAFNVHILSLVRKRKI